MISRINQKLRKLFIDAQSAINDVLVNELPVNVFLMDEEGYIAWGNKRMLSTLGLTSLDDFIGKHVSIWDKERWILCKNVINSRLEQVAEEPAGDKFYLTTRKPIFDNRNKVIGVLGVSLDITEKKQAELAKAEFLENMSHDLRTPFTGILSLTEYLHNKEEDEDKRELLGDVMTSSKRLLALLDQVLELSKQGSHPISLSHIKLSEVLQECVDLVRAEAKHKNLEITLSCPDIILHSDRMRISRIILNLLANAVKYTEKGSIKVLAKSDSLLEIAIEDSGIGIPAKALESIFARFSKLQPAYKQTYFSGAGIGLHLARTYARELDGDIRVTSEFGKGSCFTLLLKNSPLQLSQLMG